ncbi:hypothetical protein GEOBRER4_n0720 [Citrifermentans bremense]|uniref:Uncharacterized protein n=1 Tax=Citrifermentans bremense TaxID=60035 RepID=A0A7R7IZ28_9BACT|nr:hypothetical protein GEOBRER4_n0720 [Citrifermentans bremense]
MTRSPPSPRQRAKGGFPAVAESLSLPRPNTAPPPCASTGLMLSFCSLHIKRTKLR